MDISALLNAILEEIGVLAPELILVGGAVVSLIAGLVFRRQLVVKGIYLITLSLAMVLIPPAEGRFFGDYLLLSGATGFLKGLFLFTGLLLLLFRRAEHVNEFYFLAIAILVGSMFMTSTTHLLLIYLAIELTSYASYLLTGFRFDLKSSEAAIKYLLFGGISAAIMLYGLSLLYSSSGSLAIEALEYNISSRIGLVIFISGILFKTSVLPFHIWTPSTYQEAPTDAVLLFSIVPKVAGFGLIFHLLGQLKPLFREEMVLLLLVLSVITILWGTLIATMQQNLKRLIAYGAIAHSGFLLPLVLLPDASVQTFCYYALIYAFMNFGAFYVIHTCEEKKGAGLKLDDIAGLTGRNGLFGAGLVIFMVSLVGLPPTGGFTAKLLLFSNVWSTYADGQGVWWLILLVVGGLSSVVALYFYMRLPLYFFFRKGNETVKLPYWNTLITTIFAICLLYFFLGANILDNFV